ncbi:fructose-bisphosphate aldolase [[Actinomadura] parvosata subsp. kistnae]|uniref:fructose-bisphosphate aldolase n=1 Tax=[Actinomadura] parvosata subsp. kistnae TaxID=1909395 RepID=A0A1U9ZZ55_9ACTN|nr:class I fructose-bisphosphate aldolase [Nonomuraea sp. ATCC 55076]AQZ63217.1 fructose-bisphosphate aldolase [Nonomuraea sp. ATCC 55076]
MDLKRLLGDETGYLLEHQAVGVAREALHLPGPDFVDRVVAGTDRPPGVLRNLQHVFDTGRLAGTGYLSILPVDQGVEHSAAASFAPNPAYLDPAALCELAMAGGCNAIASTLGVLGSVSRRYAHRIPFIVKLNHNELLTYPNRYDQIMFASVRQAFDLGAVAVGATVYFGAQESMRQLQEVRGAFQQAHELGLFTVLWAYLRNEAFVKDGVDHQLSADLTGQANHLAATVEADIVKQKQPESNGGFRALRFGKTHDRVYSTLATEHPIELTRWQVANCYMGRVGLINSGGASAGQGDLAQAVRTAVINKRAGGMGLIVGRKSFQRPMADGVALLHAVQDVYLDPDVTVA